MRSIARQKESGKCCSFYRDLTSPVSIAIQVQRWRTIGWWKDLGESYGGYLRSRTFKLSFKLEIKVCFHCSVWLFSITQIPNPSLCIGCVVAWYEFVVGIY